MNLTLTRERNSEDRKAVIAGLVKYNDSQAEMECWTEVEIYLKDDVGRVRAGLIGYRHWGWLFIKQLWVDTEIRGQGAGTRLMSTAESDAFLEGCEYAYTDTFDFQALPFYQSIGYEVFGVLDDFPRGHKRFFLKKRLQNAKSS